MSSTYFIFKGDDKMSEISIKKTKLRNSDLKHIVLNNFYFSTVNDRISYNYDFFEIRDNEYLVGYLIKYLMPPNVNTEYIDIYIITNFRSNSIGSKALQYFINNMTERDIIAIKTTKEDKIRFLERNGFKHDDDYIYGNLYKYKRNDINE